MLPRMRKRQECPWYLLESPMLQGSSQHVAFDGELGSSEGKTPLGEGASKYAGTGQGKSPAI